MKFSQKMPLYVFYTMVQKVKNDQKLKSRGGGWSCMKDQVDLLSCLKSVFYAKLIVARKQLVLSVCLPARDFCGAL